MTRRPPRSPLFPYPPLSRSELPLPRLLDHIKGKRMLLVLDNFEQILPAAPVVGQLLDSSPALKVIASSRARSEEHTSELQSQSNLVCRLLLEKKKYNTHQCTRPDQPSISGRSRRPAGNDRSPVLACRNPAGHRGRLTTDKRGVCSSAAWTSRD